MPEIDVNIKREDPNARVDLMDQPYEQPWLFYNIGWKWSPVFKAVGSGVGHEYSFFWLYNYYYDHLGNGNNHSRYLHIFLKTVSELHPFYFSRSQLNTVESAHEHHLKRVEHKNVEPVILRSSATLTPDIVFDFGANRDAREATILWPNEIAGLRCVFLDENYEAIPFENIEIISNILPNIHKAFPLVPPETTLLTS